MIHLNDKVASIIQTEPNDEQNKQIGVLLMDGPNDGKLENNQNR